LLPWLLPAFQLLTLLFVPLHHLLSLLLVPLFHLLFLSLIRLRLRDPLMFLILTLLQLLPVSRLLVVQLLLLLLIFLIHFWIASAGGCGPVRTRDLVGMRIRRTAVLVTRLLMALGTL
jgi:hypothetical protein